MYNYNNQDNVEVYVSFLRRKFHHLQVNVTIRAIRGVGYIMEVSDDWIFTEKDQYTFYMFAYGHLAGDFIPFHQQFLPE